MSLARTARERVHEEVSAEILAVARAHLGRDGATALSLRSIAREVGMVPSALYRYFPSRDAILSALILSAYTSLADEAERASTAAHKKDAGDAERWLAVPRAMRRWAVAHPHEWGLIFGTPVPGYEAPEDTVVPYARVATALLAPVLEATRAGRLVAPTATPAPLTAPPDPALEAAVAPVADAFPDLSPAQVIALLASWTTLIGSVSLELFGHWRNTVLDPERFFEDTMARLAASFGLR